MSRAKLQSKVGANRRADNLLTAEHPERGMLWAAVDQSVHHIEGRVSDMRFGARLAPFKSYAEAEAALEAAGCILGRKAA